MVSPNCHFDVVKGHFISSDLIVTLNMHIAMLYRNLLLSLALCFAAVGVEGFLSPQRVGSFVHQSCRPISRIPTCMHMTDDNEEKNEEDRLRSLGFSEDEIRRSTRKSDTPQQNVRVDLVEDVDSFTLTAIGFGLIALNFFVFANLGDGGIGGLVATIINTVNQ